MSKRIDQLKQEIAAIEQAQPLITKLLLEIKNSKLLNLAAKQHVFNIFEKEFDVPELIEKVDINWDSIKLKFDELKTKDATKKAYLFSFKRIVTNIFNTENPTLEQLMDYDKVIEFINSDKVTGPTKKNVLNGYLKCLNLFNINTEKLNIAFVEIAKVVDEERIYKAPTEKQLENEITMADIIKKRDELQGFKHKLRQYVILSLYTYLPPLRGDEYISCHLLEDSDQIDLKDMNNYLCLKKKIMICTKYKTADKYGIKTITVPDELISILKQYKDAGAAFVISGKDNGKTNSCALVKTINTIFDKKISTSSFRKIFVSEMINNDASGQERKIAARIMSHSPLTANGIYSTYSKICKKTD